jgi:predicted small lipoprotein YifL
MQKFIILTILSALLVAGCGTKGPLVKPPPAARSQQAHPDHSSPSPEDRP